MTQQALGPARPRRARSPRGPAPTSRCCASSSPSRTCWRAGPSTSGPPRWPGTGIAQRRGVRAGPDRRARSWPSTWPSRWSRWAGGTRPVEVIEHALALSAAAARPGRAAAAVRRRGGGPRRPGRRRTRPWRTVRGGAGAAPGTRPSISSRWPGWRSRLRRPRAGRPRRWPPSTRCWTDRCDAGQRPVRVAAAGRRRPGVHRGGDRLTGPALAAQAAELLARLRADGGQAGRGRARSSRRTG